MIDSLFLILPVFLILGFGVALDIAGVLPRQTSSMLGAYVLYAALPVLLIHILAGSSIDDLLHGGFWAGLALCQVTIYLFAYAGEYVFGTRRHGPAAIVAMSSSCCNVAFIGLPVITSLMPGNHEALVAVGLSAITPIVVAAPCQVQLEYLKHSGDGSGGMLKPLVKAIFLNPLMLGVMVGFGLSVSGLGLWQPLDKAAAMLGNTTAPCMLLALGLDLRGKVRVALAGNWKAGIPRIGAVTIAKLVINPLLAWALLSWFGVTGTWLAVGVIQGGTGTALLTYVIAEIYGHVPEDVAMIAVLTNVLNLISLSVLAGILGAAGLL